MEDSQVSSPAGSPMAEMLTPRSKVAKMLADIDDAPTPSPPQAVGKISATRSPAAANSSKGVEEPTAPARSSSPHQPTKGPFHHDSEHDMSDDDDLDEPVRRPRGKAARRMLGSQKGPSATRAKTAASPTSSPPAQNAGRQEADSDDELYASTPMRPPNYSRELSGSPLRSAKSSGALFVSPAKSAAQAGSSDDNDLPNRPVASKERLAQLIAQKREERLAREQEEREQSRSLTKASKANKKRRRPSVHASPDLPEGIVEDGEVEPNPDVERIMSDAARPTRKASKKALLEMERETQRLARQQALAHQMKVKKKFTTSDLFAKFNFKQSAPADESPPAQVPGSDRVQCGDSTASSAPNSDGVLQEPASTPPSSPPTAGPTPLDKQKALVDQGALSKMRPVREDSIASLAQMLYDDDEELPDIADVLQSTQARKDADNNVSLEPSGAVFESKDPDSARKGLKLARLGKQAMLPQPRDGDSSDDDLDIIERLPAHLRAFDNIKSKANGSADSRAIHTLRHLSHIGADRAMPKKPGKANSRPSVGAKTLEAQLRRKAKEQAQQQQRERIEELKAKGVVVQSAEEREREAEVFEDLLEKARQEAAALRRAERAAEKQGAGGEGGAAEVSDDEDEDYVASDEEDFAAEDGDDEDDEEGEEGGEGLLDEAAEESDEDEADPENDDKDEEEEETARLGDEHEEDFTNAQNGLGIHTPAPGNRKSRQSRVVKDDDEEEGYEEQDQIERGLPNQDAGTEQDEDNPFAAFGFNAAGNSDDSLLSPTQAFQATMYTPTQATQEDSFDILRKIAPPSISTMPPTVPMDFGESQATQQDGSQASIVPGSQVPESQRIQLNWETQPQPETPSLPGLRRGVSGLSETPGWEPTQDDGLPSPWTGLKRASTMVSVDDDHETQSTVQMRISESPAAATAPAARRGRLVRRQAAIFADSSEDEDEPAVPAKVVEKDAFREMAKRRQAALTDAEKAEAAKEMKRMLEEQAEESEDEYAGLGGDDYVAPETEQDREMIDSSHVDVDERELARIYAERQAKEDEASMQQLMKDVGGAWRKRQTGNALDLEDEVDIAIRRRQMKQAEEARKRRLLLQDDNIKGLAEGKQSKGKDAFLKAIADDGDGDDTVDVADEDDEDAIQDTQTESQDAQPAHQPEQATAGPLREVSGNKRRLADDDWKAPSDRPPAKQRRTQAGPFRQAIDEEEISQNISFLLDEPDTGLVGPTVELDSESEPEHNCEQAVDDAASDTEEDDDLEGLEAARQNDGGFAPNPIDLDRQAMPPPRLPASQRRTPAAITQGRGVVDRLSLKRGSSTSSTDGPLSRSAWAAPASGGAAFKGPSLLRRATTNSSASGTNDRGVTIGTASLSRENSSGGGVKMGGSKKSSLAYQARAEERRAIVEASAWRREENTQKIAQMRRNSSMLSKGLTGRFE